jgi:hypothetical protein
VEGAAWEQGELVAWERGEGMRNLAQALFSWALLIVPLAKKRRVVRFVGRQ